MGDDSVGLGYRRRVMGDMAWGYGDSTRRKGISKGGWGPPSGDGDTPWGHRDTPGTKRTPHGVIGDPNGSRLSGLRLAAGAAAAVAVGRPAVCSVRLSAGCAAGVGRRHRCSSAAGCAARCAAGAAAPCGTWGWLCNRGCARGCGCTGACVHEHCTACMAECVRGGCACKWACNCACVLAACACVQA